MSTQPEWVPKSVMNLLVEALEGASHRAAEAKTANISINQRRGRIYSEFTTAARSGYAAVESTLRMAAAQVLSEKTELATDSKQSILETAAGYFTLPAESSVFSKPWNRQKGAIIAGAGGGLFGSLAPLLLKLSGFGKKVAENPEAAEKANRASGMSPFAVAAIIGGSALIGVAVHETVWRAKNRRLAEERLASLPGQLNKLYKAHAEKAFSKYVAMIEANVKNGDRAREED